jgi:serine/threonine-protein kinase
MAAARPDDRTEIGPGVEVNGYVIDGEIGKGGMGVVYSATHPIIGKRAAIKVLKSEVSRSPIIVERFIQEARAVNQIQHPNIIDIFAFGNLPDGRAYHVMDLLIGESLRKRLRRGALHPSEAASVIEQMASALSAAHDKGFIHRDFKPDNIFLVEQDGRWPDVKLLDFGLAKLMPEAGIAPFQTKTGVMLGTPEYMSPEQARGVGVDYRTDIYALGVVMFEIISGQRPFPSMGDAFATLMAHAEEPPPSIREFSPDLPLEMIQLVDTMLAKEPGARPSLAAVRTVIKRLRTTQLPTRTAAGLELSSVPGSSGQGIGGPGPLAISASRVGAKDMLSDNFDGVPTSPADPVAAGRRQSNPPVAHSDPRAPMRQPSQPPAMQSHPGATSQPGVVPSYASFHVDPTSQGDPPTSHPHMSAPPSPEVRSSGLASDPARIAPTPGIAATRLGVAPPPKLAPSQPRPAVPAPAKKSNRIWLVVGALLAIAAGIALALVLVGD